MGCMQSLCLSKGNKNDYFCYDQIFPRFFIIDSTMPNSSPYAPFIDFAQYQDKIKTDIRDVTMTAIMNKIYIDAKKKA